MTRFYYTKEPQEPKPDTRSDVEKFLASGGEVQQIPRGQSALDAHALPQKFRKRIPRGRK